MAHLINDRINPPAKVIDLTAGTAPGSKDKVVEKVDEHFKQRALSSRPPDYPPHAMNRSATQPDSDLRLSTELLQPPLYVLCCGSWSAADYRCQCAASPESAGCTAKPYPCAHPSCEGLVALGRRIICAERHNHHQPHAPGKSVLLQCRCMAIWVCRRPCSGWVVGCCHPLAAHV